MPACNSTALSAIFKNCENNSGGISEIYLIDQDDITAVNVDVTGHTVTGLTASTAFTGFEVRRNTASAVGANPIDFVAGSTYFTNTITLAFHRRESAKSRAIQILSEGQRFLAAIYKDMNGKFWFVEYLQLQSNDDTTGVARADGSSYTIVLFGEDTHMAYQIEESVVQTVIA